MFFSWCHFGRYLVSISFYLDIRGLANDCSFEELAFCEIVSDVFPLKSELESGIKFVSCKAWTHFFVPFYYVWLIGNILIIVLTFLFFSSIMQLIGEIFVMILKVLFWSQFSCGYALQVSSWLPYLIELYWTLIIVTSLLFCLFKLLTLGGSNQYLCPITVRLTYKGVIQHFWQKLV